MMKKGDKVIYDPPYTPGPTWAERRGEVFTFDHYFPYSPELVYVWDVNKELHAIPAAAIKLEKTELLKNINSPMDWEV